MKDKFVGVTINKLKIKNNLSESDTVICKYALEILYSFITKMAVVFIISFILGIILETLILILFYTFLRSFSSGIHASKNIYCWISTICIYIALPFAVRLLTFYNTTYYLLFLLFGILLIVFAPSDTPKKPMIRKEKRLRNQMLTSITVLLFLVISIFVDSTLIDNSILLAIILQAFCVNPIIYKIFNTKYNNYLYYEAKEV